MRKTWQILKYYYYGQSAIAISSLIGVLLFLLKIPASFISPGWTFFLGFSAFAFLFLLPFASSASALRGLISNPHTALIPDFHLHAGLAHFLLALATSVYLYVNLLIFSGDTVSFYFLLRTFICLSFYAVLMQLILPSRFFVPIVSFAPLCIMMILIQNREFAASLFMDENFTLALFTLCLTGWGIGIRRLAGLNKFEPANPSSTNSEAWASYDGGLFTKKAIGKSRSAAGTLLLGYPDSWTDIILRVFYYYIITPLLSTACMFIIGIGEQWDSTMMDTLLYLFLIISLFSAAFCVFMHGELVARARLVWLRFGTNRQQQWQLVEKHSLKFLFVYYSFALLIAGGAVLLTDIPSGQLWHYLFIVISYCLFNLSFSLMLKANNLSIIILVIAIFLSGSALLYGGSMVFAVFGPATYTPLITIEILLLILGLSFRKIARDTFLNIDWKIVSVRTVARNGQVRTQT